MRKKEYVHTHALLVEVTRYLSETGDMPEDALSTYDALGVSPSSIHESKRSHHEAITALYSDIDPWLERTRTENSARSMNGSH